MSFQQEGAFDVFVRLYAQHVLMASMAFLHTAGETLVAILSRLSFTNGRTP